LVGRRRADVRERLLAADVDVDVLGAAVLADDLAGVDLVAGPHEEPAAVLEGLDRVGRARTDLARDLGPGRAATDPASERAVFVELVEDGRHAASGVQDLRADADQAAGGDRELEPRRAAVLVHAQHLAAPAAEDLDHLARVALEDVDDADLDRLEALAVRTL